LRRAKHEEEEAGARPLTASCSPGARADLRRGNLVSASEGEGGGMGIGE